MKQLTYAELNLAIKSMTETEKKKPFKMFIRIDGELHPTTNRDEILCSRLTTQDKLPFQDLDYTNPNQYVIEEYLPENSHYTKVHLKHSLTHLCFIKENWAREEYDRRKKRLVEEFGEFYEEPKLIETEEDWEELENGIRKHKYVPFVPTEKDYKGQITYEELGKAIECMNKSQTSRPVKLWYATGFNLHPDDNSAHPEHGFSSKLIKLEKIQNEIGMSDEEVDKDQWVVYEYMDEEGHDACMRLHYERILLDPDSSTESREYAQRELECLNDEY